MFDINLLLGILSLQIGLQNLELNKQQIDGLDSHLNKQDDTLIKLLNKIIEQNEQILKVLIK